MPYHPKSKSDTYLTPKQTYAQLNSEFDFNHDPCPYPRPSWDGLEVPWGTRAFCNPPYSQLADWIEKAYKEWKTGGKTIVMLIPSRTDTIAFHKYILGNAELRFVKGRLRFTSPTSTMADRAPFASLIVVFNALDT